MMLPDRVTAFFDAVTRSLEHYFKINRERLSMRLHLDTSYKMIFQRNQISIESSLLLLSTLPPKA